MANIWLPITRRETVPFAAVCILAATGGVLVADSPWVAVSTLLAVPLLALLVTQSWARLGWFVVGGMAVFQLADSANNIKMAYLAGALLCALVSGIRISRSAEPWLQSFGPLVPAGLFVSAVLTMGLVTGVGRWVAMDAIRDALPYILLVLAPIVGVDAGHDLGTRTLYRFTLVLGVSAAIGFATDWLDRRGVSALPFGRFLLSTFVMGALAFTVALVMGARATGWARAGWMLAAGLISVGYLITGTRTTLVLFAAAIGVLGSSAKARVPPGRLIAIVGGVVVGVAYLLPRIAPLLISDPRFLDGRIRAALQVLDGSGADLSLQARQQAYSWTYADWQQYLLFGSGPGHRFPDGSFTADSPLTVLAKWGIVGACAFALYLVAIALVSRRIHRAYGFSVGNSVVRGFFLFLLALTPFGGVFEDKAFALAIALVTSILAASSREASERCLEPKVRQSLGQEPQLSSLVRMGGGGAWAR